ncbi:hypothetical protein DPMN_170556 [Dreissena polymorpha]|uniref:Uncharacterized protein n=1 Tax=Dreissena polymorpha TaxID=45954 RepID=A0A9D4DX93_DREPO|nr:hypothetical protein DPMN_170556 [Dreissena polymorpha]
MRSVNGYIAGIPESQDLNELKSCLFFNPAIPTSDPLRAIHITTHASCYGVTWSEAEKRLFAPDTVSHSVGARNTSITTGFKSPPKHALSGSSSPNTGRTCQIVEGLVGKGTP